MLARTTAEEGQAPSDSSAERGLRMNGVVPHRPRAIMHMALDPDHAWPNSSDAGPAVAA
jgi:hypothetical protein